MNHAPIDPEVTALIYREALLLDAKDWKAWLALYLEDAVFWMPAWQSESKTTSDPDNELNLLYLRQRANLEDRVFRIESGESFASVPLDRTVHIVSGVLVLGESGGDIEAAASWLCHVYGVRGAFTRGGRYDYLLRRTAQGLRIARKKITMIDDKLEGPIDIYHV